MSTEYIDGLLQSGGALAIALGSGVSAITEVDALLGALLTGNAVHGCKAAQTPDICVVAPDRATAMALGTLRQAQPEEPQTRVVAPAMAMPVDFTSLEGIALLRQLLPNAVRVGIVVVSPVTKKSGLCGRGLQDIAELLHNRCDAGILVFSMTSDRERMVLTNHFQALLCADSCEPDPKYSTASIVRAFRGSYLEAIGYLSVVENYRRKPDGSFERNSYHSAIASALTREIVRHVEDGKTLASIGKLVGLDKSTISRRLAGLPFGNRRRIPKDE